jgi:hypothetical protein
VEGFTPALAKLASAWGCKAPCSRKSVMRLQWVEAAVETEHRQGLSDTARQHVCRQLANGSSCSSLLFWCCTYKHGRDCFCGQQESERRGPWGIVNYSMPPIDTTTDS